MTPILLFCYNRKHHTEATINALKHNDGAKLSSLYIFSDGPKNELDKEKVDELRVYLKTIKGFMHVEIYETEKNRGLSNSIISGISKMFEKYERLIILEDDILTSSDFLTFMNIGLEKYEENNKIYSISGYSFNPTIPEDYKFDVFLSPRISSWGWATWKDRWGNVDWELKDFETFISDKNAVEHFKNGGEDLLPMIVKYKRGVIDSWAIRWVYHHFMNNAFCLVPTKSKVQNIGTDGSGTNFYTTNNKYMVEFGDEAYDLPYKIEPDDRIIQSFREFYRPSFFRRCMNYFKFRT